MNNAVLYEKKDGVATVTLNRPDRLNAVNDEIRAGLKEKLDDAAKDDEVKVIIVTGAGRGFCAGADRMVLQLQAKENLKVHKLKPKREIMQLMVSKDLKEGLVIFLQFLSPSLLQ